METKVESEIKSHTISSGIDRADGDFIRIREKFSKNLAIQFFDPRLSS